MAPAQKAELFMGGHAEHIRIDVELREPRDLQSTMQLARAYERRAEAMTPASAQRAMHLPQRLFPALPAPPCPAVGASVAPAAGAQAAPTTVQAHPGLLLPLPG
jgi:hypothetical protein